MALIAVGQLGLELLGDRDVTVVLQPLLAVGDADVRNALTAVATSASGYFEHTIS